MRRNSIGTVSPAVEREVGAKYSNVVKVANNIEAVVAVDNAIPDITTILPHLDEIDAAYEASQHVNNLSVVAEDGDTANVTLVEDKLTFTLPSGRDGTAGIDGVGIDTLSTTDNTITIKLTNGITKTVSDVKGSTGEQGETGVGIERIELVSYQGIGGTSTYDVYLTNDTTTQIYVKNGNTIESFDAVSVNSDSGHLNRFNVVMTDGQTVPLEVRNGYDGASAYMQAVAHGYTGTEAEYVDVLNQVADLATDSDEILAAVDVVNHLSASAVQVDCTESATATLVGSDIQFEIPAGENGLTPLYEFVYNSDTGDLEYNLTGYTVPGEV